ncbi:MAG: SufD family Fe-S cluster assembly protein [Brevinematales bacterium]|nr:SufD family Fe-S cluster assembly protein [Brevinematales bacterium]
MNYTNFLNYNDRIMNVVQKSRNDLESWGNTKLPIIAKSNPKYNIDFSNRIPNDTQLYFTKISFEIVFDPIVDVTIELDKTPTAKARVGEEIVKKGFFVKDLYLSLAGEDNFTYQNFLSILSPEDSIFVSYGISFIKSGLLIYIPEDTETSVKITKKVKNTMLGSFYSMIFLGNNSNVKIYEDIVSETDDSNFIFEISEIFVGNNTNLWYNIIQNINTKSEYFSTRKVKTNGSSNIEFNDVSLGASYERIDDRVYIEGQNIELKYTGIYFTNGSQKYDILVTARHRGLHQGADIIVKGVLDDKSKVYFNGTLKVEEKLKSINSYLGGHSLHLSSECKSDSIPSLEIDSYDVKSGHAASLTQLDEEKLFYMMSRGLSEYEAKKAIVQGFIEGAVRRITDKEFGLKVKKYLKEKGLDVVDVELEVY